MLGMSQTCDYVNSTHDDLPLSDTLNIRISDKEHSSAVRRLCSDELLVFPLLISVFGDRQSACLCCGNSLKCNLNILVESIISAAHYITASLGFRLSGSVCCTLRRCHRACEAAASCSAIKHSW